MSVSIEITIPVLNEEESIKNQILILSTFLKEKLSEFPNIFIVIADNGSTDKTQEFALELSNQIPNLKYIRLNERGVGRALKASWASSEAQIIGYMDLDLATDLNYLKPAIHNLLDGYDIVTGSRLKKGSKVIGRSPLRGFTSRAFNLIVKTLFRTKFSDGMCGFKFLKREKLPKIMAGGADSDGWFFATELLVVGECLNYKIKDLPVTWKDDPNSKVKIVKLSIEYLKNMLTLRRKIKQAFNV